MHYFHIICICNRHTDLLDDFSGIYLMFQEESSDTSLRVTINDCPVDGSSSTILRKQRCMEIECAQPGHIPYHFRQHTEGNHNLQIRFPFAQCFHESLILQLFRLKQRQILFKRILFNGRILNLMSASGRLIGHCYHAHNVITAFYQLAQSLHRKIGSAHIYYS